MTAVLTEPAEQPSPQPRRGRRGWIDVWEPENPTFWRRTGRRIAWRNLGVGVAAEHLAFNVWLLMSVVVVRVNDVGFAFTTSEKFLLVIVPNLVGAVLRVPYTFALPVFGGRAWTTIATSLLLVPCGMLAYAVTSGASFWFFLLTSAAMGLGGATFSSSMANMSFFFPDREKGFALGLNAAGGNIGAAVAQLVVPIVISLGTGINLVYAALLWLPLIVISAACAWLFMDSLTTAKPDGSAYRTALRNKHTWIASLLYVGAFGSFIGFSFAFPLLIGTSFAEYERYVGLAFLGALISALCRPVGGWLADRHSGARITVLAFAGMTVGATSALVSVVEHDFGLFFCSFIALFVLTGIGNGAIYRMIPSIFSAQAGEQDDALDAAKRQAAAVVGLTGAIGAIGGVMVNLVFRFALSDGGSLVPALAVFIGFYGVCIAATWWFYLRSRFAIERAPNLAYASV